MKLILESEELHNYLKQSLDIDYSHLLIREKVLDLYQECDSEITKIKIAYNFVRDEIAHSLDIKSPRITRRASEVLAYKEGKCSAKSNLLAALLRAINIPTGLCYQRVTLGDTPESGYGLHALNAVYIFELKKWIRLDARGNKDGVNAQFSTEEEHLAFPIRTYYDEIDYPTIYL
ncbi:MAG: transglutaminase-like domain-containing protein [Desulfosporosinus sp.]|nr:transglutaminase-like domain-containing protein [Desulfosporosinus sp.]